MNRDQRGQLLAALREIFDGSWTRHVGVDGGGTAGDQTQLPAPRQRAAAIDSHHAVMSVRRAVHLVSAANDQPSQTS
jgi:hypothetical protein